MSGATDKAVGANNVNERGGRHERTGNWPRAGNRRAWCCGYPAGEDQL